jgi:hypothetical protein
MKETWIINKMVENCKEGKSINKNKLKGKDLKAIKRFIKRKEKNCKKKIQYDCV